MATTTERCPRIVRHPECASGSVVSRNRCIRMRPLLRAVFLHSRRRDMRISARNQLRVKIVAVTKGATPAHVRIELNGGAVITASITNEAVEELGLKVGTAASAIIKASDVMVAV